MRFMYTCDASKRIRIKMIWSTIDGARIDFGAVYTVFFNYIPASHSYFFFYRIFKCIARSLTTTLISSFISSIVLPILASQISTVNKTPPQNRLWPSLHTLFNLRPKPARTLSHTLTLVYRYIYIHVYVTSRNRYTQREPLA